MYWYVVTNNTSWCDIEVALVSGPYSVKAEAEKQCMDNSQWVLLLTPEDAAKITY